MHTQTGASCAHRIENVVDEKGVDGQTQGTRAGSAAARCSLHGVERERASPEADLSRQRSRTQLEQRATLLEL